MLINRLRRARPVHARRHRNQQYHPEMSQRSFASAEYAMKKKHTRRERFLADMERVVPWARLIAVIEPLYPTSGRAGRQPIGVSRMLRMYCLQQWYGLADEALEDALYFGMKAHVGVDAESGLVHTVVATAANVNDVTQAGALLHGQETVAFGDAGYRGVHKREEAHGPKWHVAMQPGKRRQLDPRRMWARLLEKAEQLKASIRAKVEHPFHVIKNLFRHRKTRYKGLAKNEARLFSLFGLANLVIAKRSPLIAHARGAS